MTAASDGTSGNGHSQEIEMAIRAFGGVLNEKLHNRFLDYERRLEELRLKLPAEMPRLGVTNEITVPSAPPAPIENRIEVPAGDVHLPPMVVHIDTSAVAAACDRMTELVSNSRSQMAELVTNLQLQAQDQLVSSIGALMDLQRTILQEMRGQSAQVGKLIDKQAAMLEALLKQKPPEVKITVDTRKIAEVVEQLIERMEPPAKEKRHLVISHSDGSESTVEER